MTKTKLPLKNSIITASVKDNLNFSAYVNFCAILPDLGFHIIKKGIRFIIEVISTKAKSDKIYKSMPLFQDKKKTHENKKDVTAVMLKKCGSKLNIL